MINNDINSKTYTAAIFLADGFEEIETVTTHDILVRAKFKVELIGTSNKTNYLGSCGLVIQSSKTLNHMKNAEYDILILPGGPGVEEIENNEELKKLFTKQYQAGKWIAGICAAPCILGKWNLLKKHNAVCYPSMQDILKPLVAKFVDADVVVSGNVITSRALSTALLFAHTIVSEVHSLSKAKEVSSDTIFDLGLDELSKE